MQSLKTFLPKLSEIIGVTIDQAYERQRILVKARVLKARPGRGPGSGVPATPRNIALLLIALMVGDFREHSVATIKQVANSMPLNASSAPYNASFLEALTQLIAVGFPSYDQWPKEIRWRRDTLEAEIDVRAGVGFTTTHYQPKASAPPGKMLHVASILLGRALQRIRQELVSNPLEKLAED